MKWIIVIVLLFGVFGAVSAQETDVVPVFSDPVEAAGDVLIVYGHVLDSNGDPVEGAAVEIWQTDSFGVYDHPNADAANSIDANFQHFGAYITDADGAYAFRTIVPSSEGIGRPLHIHVKVKLDGEELLTTQFYFTDDPTQSSDQFFAEAGENADLMILEPIASEDGAFSAAKDLIVSLGEMGTLTLTPTQTEGPFYPVVDVSSYDNDLAVVSEQTNPANEVATAVEFTLLNLNTVTGDELLATIPDFSNRMVREFQEYRPYVSIQQFRREIGKYVSDEQVTAWEAYVYVPVDVNNSDAATLMQIPGVDQTVADALIAARPFASNDAFLQALSGSPLAAFYLVSE